MAAGSAAALDVGADVVAASTADDAVLDTDEAVSPFVSGVVRATVVLPAALVEELSREELTAVLAHEFAHLRRRDPAFGWLLAICEAMYFFLSRVPESRQTLDRIDKSLITNQPDIAVSVDGDPNQPLLRVIDPWGETLRYSYYENDQEDSNEPPIASPRTFPIITSAGPDKEFGSTDDIVSR